MSTRRDRTQKRRLAAMYRRHRNNRSAQCSFVYLCHFFLRGTPPLISLKNTGASEGAHRAFSRAFEICCIEKGSTPLDTVSTADISVEKHFNRRMS
jgi:hypothetical protein